MRRLCTFLTAHLWAGVLAVFAAAQEPAAPLATTDDVRAALAEVDRTRRRAQFEDALAILQATLDRTTDEVLRRDLALAAADLQTEADLFGSFIQQARDLDAAGQPLTWPGGEDVKVRAPTATTFRLARDQHDSGHEWADLPASTLVRLMAAVPLEPDQQVELARFAMYREVQDRALELLHTALVTSPGVKERVDPILAAHFGEALPPGGYAWYRGEFRPAVEVNRRRHLDEVFARIRRALPGSPLQAVDPHAVDAGQLDTLAPVLAQATDQLVAGLRERHEPVRDLIASYRRSSNQRKKRLEHVARMQALADEARAFIGKYEKKDQSTVDDYRAQLEKLYQDYLRIRKNDEVRLQRLDQREAAAELQRIQHLESALDTVIRYRTDYHGRVTAPFPGRSPEGARTQVLPGRVGAGLEDVWYTLLHWKAGRTLAFLRRATDLLAASAELTVWERVVLRDHLHDAIQHYNGQVLTTADTEEWNCVRATNDYRRVLLLAPYELDERLVQSARGHSKEMKRLGYFGHNSPIPERRTPGHRIRLAGYDGGGGENCFAGGNASGRAAFEAWYHSPGHHRGLISGSPHVGVGADPSHDLWTMNFAGNDRAWRRHHRDLTAEQTAAIERDLDRVLRDRDPDGEAEAALIEAGLEGLPVVCRTLTRSWRDPAADRRRGAARLARITAVVAVQEGLPEIGGHAVEALLALLDDAAAAVRSRAVFSLRQLAEQKLGYAANAPGPRREPAVARWRQWWSNARENFAPRADVTAAEVEALVEVTDVIRTGPSPDAPMKVFTAAERLALARRLGGSRETERAVASSLDWLARHQSPDGGWYGKGFRNNCREGRECQAKANSDWDVALSGLALLCFLNGGHTLEVGEHRRVIQRGVEFLMSRQQDTGRFTSLSSHYMYQHALATQALCEAYGTSGDPFVKEAAQKAVDYLMFAQDPNTGGWRYEPRQGSDTSVVGWQLLALASARKAGFRILGLRAALEWLDHVTEGSYYRVGYISATDRHAREVRLTAVAMVCRQIIGTSRKDPRLTVGAFRCLEQLPREDWLDLYFSYYATLALFQMGGESWDTWNEAMVEALLARVNRERGACAHGSYDPVGPWSGEGGRILSTTLSTLMLEVYYRYEKFPEHPAPSVTGSVTDLLQPLLDRLGRDTPDIERGLVQRRIEEEFGHRAQAPLVQRIRESDDAFVQHRAAEVLARVATSAIVTELLALLEGADDHLVAQLNRALARAASPAAVPALIQGLQDPRRAVRGHAARTLGSLGDVTALGPLLDRSKVEKDGWVKGELNNALRRIAERSALDRFLDVAFEPSDTHRRRAARDGLAILEQDRLCEAILAEQERDPERFARLVEAVRAHGRQASVPVLITCLELADVGARERAIRLLRALTLRSYDYDPKADEGAREAALARWQRWWREDREVFLAPFEEPGSTR